MRVSIMPKDVSTDEIRKVVLDEKGKIRPLPSSEWLRFSWDEIRLFMHEEAVYVLPTMELIAELRGLINGYKTIEICAGGGNIGRHLGIRMTDSYMQERPEIQAIYALAGQPVIKYPPDVIKCYALSAIRILKPQCVLGCYATHLYKVGMKDGNALGVDFEKLLPKVKRLILVGNHVTHGENPIMSLPHSEIVLEKGFILTRNADRSADRIFVWDN